MFNFPNGCEVIFSLTLTHCYLIHVCLLFWISIQEVRGVTHTRPQRPESLQEDGVKAAPTPPPPDSVPSRPDEGGASLWLLGTPFIHCIFSPFIIFSPPDVKKSRGSGTGVVLMKDSALSGANGLSRPDLSGGTEPIRDGRVFIQSTNNSLSRNRKFGLLAVLNTIASL